MSEQRFVLDKLYYTIMTPIEKISVGKNYITYGEVVDLLNEQQARIEMLEKGILDCLFNNKSIGILAEEMRIVE